MINKNTLKIAISGNYATQFITKSLKNSFKKAALAIELHTLDYNQTDFEFFNRESALFQFKPDYILLHETVENLKESFYSCSVNERLEFATVHLQRIADYAEILKEALPAAKLIYPGWEMEDDMVFGNYSSKIPQSLAYQIRRFNWELLNLSMQKRNVYCIDSNRIALAIQEKRNYTFAINADLHFSIPYLDFLSGEVVKIVKTFQAGAKKCIILDLDNTLWGGTIGDDGIEHIEIGDLGTGKAFTKFQKWIKELKNRGIILAVCSKNNLITAQEPFEKHEDMVLRLDDIAVFVANWENKADNIKYIQSILNIGFDSMVFLDDNPAERKIVKDNLPEVTVPDLPEDPAYYLPYLKELNLFETVSFSDNDKDRTRQYQEEAKRTEYSKTLTNIDEYLKSLEMNAIIEPFRKEDFSRIAQLTLRSNQFNLRTIRYTDADIERIASDQNFLTCAVKLKDRFGDYGLISVVILERKKDSCLLIHG